jgi:hypothetical protein
MTRRTKSPVSNAAKTVWGAVIALAVAAPGGLTAQTWQDVQVADIETMRDKFVGLAGAFEESQYDWQPMDGVRSVREVLGLTIAEANLFPTGWGHPAGPGSARGFEAEMSRASALSKEETIRELRASFEHLIAIVRGMDEAERTAQGSYFGRPMPVHASIATAMADMHEHLGQLIAYARTNHVVPPWSAGN